MVTVPPESRWRPRCGVLSRPRTHKYAGSLRPCITTSSAPRRRAPFRQALLALVLVTLAIPAASPAYVAQLPLEQQVGQLVVLSFQGTSAPEYVLAALRERRAAGVILFGGNVESPRQLRTLTAALRSAGNSPLIAVDQEGGDVRILPWAPPTSSAPSQAAAGTVGRDAKQAGLALRRVGVNVSLAPVADVPSVAGSALASRSFSRDPKRASTAVAASVAGWRAAGVARHGEALPGPRSRHGQHGRRAGDDPPRPPAALGNRRAAVRRRRPRRCPARDGLARPLPRPRPAPDRVPVPSDHPGLAPGSARFPRRGDHGLDGGGGLTRHRQHHGHIGAGRPGGRRSRALDGPRLVSARLPTPAREGASSASFRQRVREAAARVLALRAGL